MPRRYLIAGMGPAGIAAATTIRHHDPEGDILLVSEETHGYYSRPGLAYYLTGEIPEELLFPFDSEDFQRLRLRRRLGRVTHLDPAAHVVTLSGGETLAYDRLLLATGSQAVMPSIPGSELEGVVKLDDLDDARRILAFCRRARAAVVVGGGITALEIVEGLRARRTQTHYLIRRDRYWSNVLDETESRIVEHRLKEEGVQIHYYTETAEIIGRRGQVTGVRTTDGRILKCGLVALAIGVRPRHELAIAAGLEVDRGIMVDEHMNTSASDVYAAGDVAQVHDPHTGRAVLDTLWSAALAQGRAAGTNMAGLAVPYRKAIPFNVTRLSGLTTTLIGTVGRGRDEDLVGIARGDSETWRQLPPALGAAGSIATQDSYEVNRLRIVIGRETLVGAVVMGDQTLSRALHQLVAHQVNISPIRDQLFDPAVHLGNLITSFWTAWREEHAPS